VCYAAQPGPNTVSVPAAGASLALAEKWPNLNKVNTFEKSVIWKSGEVHNVSLKSSFIAHTLVHLLLIPTLFIISMYDKEIQVCSTIVHVKYPEIWYIILRTMIRHVYVIIFHIRLQNTLGRSNYNLEIDFILRNLLGWVSPILCFPRDWSLTRHRDLCFWEEPENNFFLQRVDWERILTLPPPQIKSHTLPTLLSFLIIPWPYFVGNGGVIEWWPKFYISFLQISSKPFSKPPPLRSKLFRLLHR